MENRSDDSNVDSIEVISPPAFLDPPPERRGRSRHDDGRSGANVDDDIVFPEDNNAPAPRPRRLSKMTPARCATTTASRATTSRTPVAIPIKTKTVVRLSKVEANQVNKTTASFVAVAVAVADAVPAVT